MDLSYEFVVLNNIVQERAVPIWQEIETKEELAAFRAEFPHVPTWLKPKRIIIGEGIEEIVLKEDIKTRRLIPNILKITIQEAMDSQGKVYKDRFWVEEESGKKYMVRGNFYKMKAYRKNLLKKTNIGFYGKEISR